VFFWPIVPSFDRLVINDRSSWTNEQSVAICGSEDAIRVVIPDKYGAVWCYDEIEGKIM
jgi:hypothetical protein